MTTAEQTLLKHSIRLAKELLEDSMFNACILRALLMPNYKHVSGKLTVYNDQVNTKISQELFYGGTSVFTIVTSTLTAIYMDHIKSW